MSDLDTKEYTVTISKTVQERQYEPLTVTLTTTGTAPHLNFEKEQDAAYQQLKQKIQAIFNPSTVTSEAQLAAKRALELEGMLK